MSKGMLLAYFPVARARGEPTHSRPLSTGSAEFRMFVDGPLDDRTQVLNGRIIPPR